LRNLSPVHEAKTYPKLLDWSLSPVAQHKTIDFSLETSSLAQRGANKAETVNLDGLLTQSNTLHPFIAGRELDADDSYHNGRSRLAVGEVVGACPDMMRSYPWKMTGGGDKPKAAGSRPRELGIQQGVTQNTENLVTGKRKRSVGQDANTQAEVSNSTSAATVTSNVNQRAKATIRAGTPSSLPYFSTASLSHTGPTPPMSPDKQSVLEDVVSSSYTLSASKLESLKRNLKTQIGLEILLKHDELRLIEQELGKCQIALEQLRRCTEIPYPATNVSLDVSNGVGLPARSNSAGPLPRSPAPWGVADGPYSRHYAKWLLPDPSFDGGDEFVAAGQHSEFARSTRGKPIESVITTSKRGSKSKAPIISSVPKDKSGPMIIKRKSDGKMVKLRCLDCARDDFGSAQGFINHCRIQHHRSFTSHDAAAAACGKEVELDPTGAVVGGGAAPQAQTTCVPPSSGTVHPLILSAHFIKPTPDIAEAVIESPHPASIVSTPPSPTNFQASPFAPHLSTLIRNKGLGIDVQGLVTETKEPLMTETDDDMESEEDAGTPMFQGQQPRIAGTKQSSSSSSSHTSQGGKTASFGQLRGGAILSSMQTDLLSDESGELELEPSPTNESNQAPSLVDDDEDDDYGGHSPASTSESDDNDSEVNFQIEDEEDMAGPSTTNLSPLYADSAKQQIGSVERRPSAFRRQFSNSRKEKHVTFVSPSPARDVSGHDSKRTKVGN
jgi:ADA HAT complex component 1